MFLKYNQLPLTLIGFSALFCSERGSNGEVALAVSGVTAVVAAVASDLLKGTKHQSQLLSARRERRIIIDGLEQAVESLNTHLLTVF